MQKVENNISKWKRILVGSIFSVVVTALIFLIFSLILSYTSVTEETIEWIVKIVPFLTLFIVATITSHEAKSGGLLIGGGIGIAFVLFSVVVRELFFEDLARQVPYIGIRELMQILVSCIGGIFGINYRVDRSNTNRNNNK